jgi:hypothetical protein
MKSLLLNISIFFLPFFCLAQTEIKLEDVSKHIGDSVVITGKIYSGRYLNSSKGSPTLLNMGDLFPNQLLTLVVWGSDRKNFSNAPETFYIGKNVRVSGKVTLFKEKPQLVLYSEKQITPSPL